jgi:hypothetical protein
VPLIGALLWVALAAWAIASPVGASPDEDYHLAMLYCAAGEADCTTEGVRAGPCYAMKPEVSADCAAYATRTAPDTTGIIPGHYPPLYYAAMSAFVGPTLGDTTLTIRLINATLTVLVVIASVALSAPVLRIAVGLSWLAAVPLGLYFLTSVNPTAWSILALAGLWGPLLTWLTSPSGPGVVWTGGYWRRQTIIQLVFIMVLAVMGLGARSETALWLPLIAGVVALFPLPWPLGRRSWADPRLLRLVLPVVLVVMSLITLLVYSGAKADRIAEGVSTAATPAYRGWQIVQQTLNSVLGVLGLPGVPGSGLGTYDVPVPAVAAAAVTAALAGLVLIGLGAMYTRKALALGSLTVLGLTVTGLLWSQYNWEYFQPRYFLPLLFVFVGLALLPGLARARRWPALPTSPRITDVQFTVVLACVAVANAMALLSTMLRYVRGVQYQPTRDPLTERSPIINPGGLPDDLPDWWLGSVSPLTAWVLGSVAFTIAVALGWLFLTTSPTIVRRAAPTSP